MDAPVQFAAACKALGSVLAPMTSHAIRAATGLPDDHTEQDKRRIALECAQLAFGQAEEPQES